MIVERSKVDKIRISDVQSLDPVEVVIENYSPGRGKIVITCFGQSWTGFWSAMGGTVEEFFQWCSNDYLIDKMSSQTRMVPDIESDEKFLKKMILEQRRRGAISQEEAREAWSEAGRGWDRNSLNSCGSPDAFDCLEGMCEPWHMDWPRKENPEYHYLGRIIDAVREAIKPEGYDEK